MVRVVNTQRNSRVGWTSMATSHIETDDPEFKNDGSLSVAKMERRERERRAKIYRELFAEKKEE